MIHPEHVISMTELQKLSLKKLRKTKLPLIVVDQKSKRKGFVILDYPSYEALAMPVSKPTEIISKPPAEGQEAAAPDYRKMGLLWDRPDLTDQEFQQRLKDPSHWEHVWAASRFLERIPSQKALQLHTPDEIESFLKVARIRSFFRKPWENAFQYWHQRNYAVVENIADHLYQLLEQNYLVNFIKYYELVSNIHLPVTTILAVAMKKYSGIDPVFLADHINIIQGFSEPPDSFKGLREAPWSIIQTFFSRLHDEILDSLHKL